MRRLLITTLTLFLLMEAYSQSITLDSCQSLARKNHPILKQMNVIEEITSFKIKSINATNYPQIDLTGKATYQSDVTEMLFKNPAITGLDIIPHDQYRLYIDIKQKIYDGGIAKNRKKIEGWDNKIQKEQNEVEIFKIKESVNGLYFNILALKENQNLILLKQEVLKERIKNMESALKNGVGLESDLDYLKAELIVAQQQNIELKGNDETARVLLSIIIGTEIVDNVDFIKPEIDLLLVKEEFNRPEIKLLSLQNEKIDDSDRLLKSSRLPNFYTFGQVGYGQPGLNMLNPEFDSWYMVGVGLSWNVFDWNKNKNERNALQLQKKMVMNSDENIRRNLSLSLSQEKGKINQLEEISALDRELIVLKENIAKRSQSALDNGTITSADYIRDLNAMLQAKATLSIREIQISQAKINYINILGK